MESSWIPHDGAQEEFCSRGEFEVLYGGAAGPGKTSCLIALALRHVDKPNYKALILRRTYPRLEEIIDRCHDLYPSFGGEWRETKRRWTFPSGATIKLGHMQHEDDKRDYTGKEYQFIGWDELTEFTDSQYTFVVNSRARTKDSSIPVRIRATTNPGGLGHVWVKKRFVDIAEPGKTYIDPETGLSRVFVRGLVTDNPTLMENDPLYVKRLAGLPAVERKRLLEGDWEIFEGQMFAGLSKNVHGIEPFDIPPEWERVMTFDYGYARPFAALWFAVDHDGVIYLYREHYGRKIVGAERMDEGLRMVARDVAKGIIRIEDKSNERIRTRIADPSIFHNVSSRRHAEVIGTSPAEDMLGEGLFFLKADNDRIHGIQQVHRRLQVVEHLDTETGEITSSPQFYAFNDLNEFWRTMLLLQACQRNPDDVNTDQEDHIYDAFRYMCMYRPVKPKHIDEISPGTFQFERKRYIRAKTYAKRHGVGLDAAYQRVRR